MKARYKLLFAAVAAMLATTGASQPVGGLDGNTLLAVCSTADALQTGYCIGYMVGYREGRTSDWYTAKESKGAGSDTTEGEADVSVSRPLRQWILPNLPHHQIRDVVIDYIKEHPETRHERAGSIISESLQVAFPCETGM